MSFDGNFRPPCGLGRRHGLLHRVPALLYVDVLLGIEPYHLWKDENDHSKGDWKDGVPPCSPATSSKTRFSSGLSSATPT